jgi:hypothetical protein
MVYGNRNKTGVCGAWAAEQQHLKKLRTTSAGPADATAPAWVRSSRKTAEGLVAEAVSIDSSNEMEYDQSTTTVALGASATMNQGVWMEQQYKLFACNNADGEPLRV